MSKAVWWLHNEQHGCAESTHAAATTISPVLLLCHSHDDACLMHAFHASKCMRSWAPHVPQWTFCSQAWYPHCLYDTPFPLPPPPAVTNAA